MAGMNEPIGGEALETPSLRLPELIREIARGTHGARDLDQEEARRLFGAMLDGAVPPLELGAVLIAYGIKGESAEELGGFVAALDERMAHLEAPRDRPRPVVLAAYDAAGGLADRTALLALLLRRYAVPVLLHGTAETASDDGRVATAGLLWELGIEPATSANDAKRSLASEGIAFFPIEALAPDLCALLSLRRRLGQRSSAHTVSKLIDPFSGAGIRVVSANHSHDLARMRRFLVATRADALLLDGTDGESFVDPRRQPRIERFASGVGTPMFEAEDATAAMPQAIDAPATAAWISATLSGAQPIPPSILNQLACCLHATRRAGSG
jgi:anthranilate phosphoribosyltransferase